MKIFGKTLLISLFLAAVMLAACDNVQSTPTLSQADMMETAISTVSTALAETQGATTTTTPMILATSMYPALPTISFFATRLPPPTPFPSPTLGPTSTPLVFSDPSIPLSRRIVYYYPVWAEQGPVPEGTVQAIHLFAPAYTDETFTSDTAADLRRALEIILHEDSRRVWDSSDLEIVEVTFRNGHADVILQGEYFVSLGDAQPCGASMQILLTVFANPSVQTVTVTLNGGLIGTACSYGPPSPPLIQTVNDVYARADVETYMEEHPYVSP